MIRLIFLSILLPLGALCQSLPYNSAFDEQAPVLSPDGTVLYYTVAGNPLNRFGKRDPGDIWATVRTASGWTAPELQLSWSNSAYNAVIGFSDSGKEIFLMGHYHSDGSPAPSQGISVARKTATGWSMPENIYIPYFLNRSVGSGGFVNATGDVLVFAASGPLSIGAEDLFVSLRGEGGWSEPFSIGPVVNSAFQEWSPSLSEDNKLLFFSSNRQGGSGSFDVYQSERQDDSWKNWSKPAPLTSINSEGRELFYRETSNYRWYTSTRDSDGYGDVKTINIGQEPEPPALAPQPIENRPLEATVPEKPTPAPSDLISVKGRVLSSADNRPLPAKLTLKGTPPSFFSSDINGAFSFELKKGTVYTVEAEHKGFIGSITKIDLLQNAAAISELIIKLQPASVGTVVNLNSVLFRQSTASLLEESYDELDMVVGFLKTNPSIRIELAGHTDNRGDRILNIKLSSERVKKVKNYLVSKGIDSQRIQGKGYGGAKPIADNRTEEGRRLNRRVEFRIIQ